MSSAQTNGRASQNRSNHAARPAVAADRHSARSRRPRGAISRAVCESIESRTMLAAALANQIPATITPSSVPQTLLSPGANASLLQSNTTNAAVSRFRFSVNNVTPGQQTNFSIARTNGVTSGDAAIALYDASGNRIALRDADSPNAQTESVGATLQSGVPYTAQFFATSPGVFVFIDYAVTIDTGLQRLADTVRINPATGSGSLNTSAAPNAFTSPGAVRYFPIDFTNAGASASVLVSAAGPDSSVAASLYRQTATDAWTMLSSGNLTVGGAAASLAATPPANANVTDGTYLLAVAPLNFTASAAPVNVTASTSQLLAPATVNPGSAAATISPSLTAPGNLSAQSNFGLVAGSPRLTAIVATTTGPLTVEFSTGFRPTLSLYGPNGTPLLDVATSTVSATTIRATIAATAGTTYYALAARDGPQNGEANLSGVTASQGYAPADVAVTGALGQQANLPLAPSNGGRVFRLTAPSTARYLAVQLAPVAGSTVRPQLTILPNGGTPQTYAAPAGGQPVTVVLDATAAAGPYDVLVTGLSGSGNATLRYVALAVPETVAVNQFPTAVLNNSTGTVVGNVIPAATGTPVGFQYFQPSNGATPSNTQFSAIATNGAAAVLLHYVQDGSVLRLADSAAPTAGGNAAVATPARGQVLHAVVALPVNFSGGGTVQLTVAGPLPVGVGVQMVPNAVPGAAAPAEGYRSAFNVNGDLDTNLERDLFTTQLPANLTGTTTSLAYAPVDVGGPLRVTVSVLNANNVVIVTATSAAGAGVSVPVSGLVAGQTLRFEVKAVNNTNVGTGGYRLALSVATSNPLPHLVTQEFFYPFAASQVPGRSYLPNNVAIPTIPLNGSVQGNFTSSAPYNNNGTGSIQVFRVTGWTSNAPFTVSTTDVDAGANTNFALYYLSTDNGGNVAYRRLRGTAPSFDYLPGDRSSVDSRIVVNNTDLAPVFDGGEFGGPITVYAVVMNEGGALGRYAIAATQPNAVELAGPGNATPATILVPAPRAGGSFIGGQETIQSVNATTFALRTPTGVNGNGTPVLSVRTVNFSQGQTITVNIGRGIIAVGTVTGTVGAGGVANIQLLGQTSGGAIFSLLGSNQTYQVTVTASSFPASGLGLRLTVPYVTPAGTVPPTTINFTPLPLDAFYTPAIRRMRPAPTGAISEQLETDDGAFRTLFSMPKAGLVSFTINSSSAGSPAVGLYRTGKTPPPAPHNDVSVLIDFDNTRTANNFTITANLPAGTYWLRGQGFDDAAPVTITGTIPAFEARVLVAQPGTGLTTQAEQTIINPGALGNTTGTTTNGFVSSRYGSSLFKFVVPANASGGPVTFRLDDRTSVFAAQGSPVPPVGTATISLYRLANGTYARVASAVDAVRPGLHTATVSAGEPAVPGAEYFALVDLNAFQYAAYVGFDVPILTTGIGDFSVQPITLSPNAGQTLVRGAIVNSSFSASPAGSYTLGLGGVVSTRSLPPLAPFGSVSINLPWTPGAASDVVTIVADPTNAVPELSQTNNARSTTLASVNPNAPSVRISLVDANITAEGNAAPSVGGGAWGRYITGVAGQTTTIRVAGTDVDSNLFAVYAQMPGNAGNGINSFTPFYVPTVNGTANIPVDFGTLPATSATNLNQLRFFAVDQFGLRTPAYVQRINVAQPPEFLTGGVPDIEGAVINSAGGEIKFNRSTRVFTYKFTNNIIRLNKTLTQLLGFDVPVVGGKKNEFVISISGTGTSGLSPVLQVPLVLTGRAALTAMDKSIFDKSYTANQQYGNVLFRSQLELNGRSLVPGAATVSLQLSNLELLDVQTPLIPIVQIGVPGIASVSAGVRFGLSAKLNAAVKLGLDPSAVGLGGYLGSLGMMSPSFIAPEITGTASVVGNANVLGFDIAELSGTVGLTLKLTIGLDNDQPGRIVPFGEALGGLGVRLDARLTVKVLAEVCYVDVFEYEYDEVFDGILDTLDEGIFLTDPPSFAPGKFLAPTNNVRPRSGRAAPKATVKGGDALVGAYRVEPSPQLVINNATPNGAGLSVQIVNAGTANAPLGNLAFSTRTNGVWSALTPLPQSSDVFDAELALTRDGPGTPAVVVYAVDKATGSSATRTVNGRLSNQDLRYRYFNGTTWGAEANVGADGLYDSQHAVAFNANGAGALAYVKNTNATPVGASGLDSAANEIYASTWNAATHAWGASVAITSGGGNDTQPSAFVDASGTRYVVWVRANAGGGSQLMFSTNSGGAWSAPATLATNGLRAGGEFRGVTVGSDGAGRVTTLFSYVVPNADGTLDSALYQRPAFASNFATNLPAVQVAANANYSGLRTTPTPGGALVAYWQQSDGQQNHVYETTITQGSATTPAQVTTSPDVAKRPSIAVDGDGKIQVMYENVPVFGGASKGSPTDPTIGTPVAADVATSSAALLPQFSFSAPLEFELEQRTAAAIGSQVFGSAVITNRGFAGGSFRIDAIVGLPGSGTIVNQRVIQLDPGQSFDYAQLFPVSAGTQTYSLNIFTLFGNAFNISEYLTTATLIGRGDVEAVSLINDVAFPSPGTPQTLFATIRNNSTAASGIFNVTLYAGDPRSPQLPLVAVETRALSLFGSQSTTQAFNVNLPAGAGDRVYTLAVDPAEAVPESNEFNNYARYQVSFRADPAISGSPPVLATLLNGNTADNVRIDATVTNSGDTAMTNVPVNLRVSRNGGPFVSLGQTVIASLPAGATQAVSFTVTARGGDNLFVVALDPAVNAADVDLSNNTGSASLLVPGVATLSATASLSSSVSIAGGPLTLTANLVNAGLADVEGVPLVVVATPQGGGAGVIVGTASLGVAGLSNGSVAINLDTSGLPRGVYTFTLQIDPDATVLQAAPVDSIALTGVIATPLVISSAAQYLRLDAGGTRLDIWDEAVPSGSPDQQYLLTTVSALSTAFGSVANLFVDFANGSPVPAGGLTFDATGALSRLTVLGSSAIDSFGLNGASVTYARGATTGTIAYANLGALSIGSGGSEDLINLAGGNPLPARFGLDGTFTLNGFTGFANTTVDLGDSNVYLTYAPGNNPVATIRQALIRGYNNGAWNGSNTSGTGAINSAAAALGTTHAIGYADAADGTGTNPRANTIQLKYTRRGDTDLDGDVDFQDLVRLAQNYGLAPRGWTQGDLDYSGTVTFSDLVIMAQQYGTAPAALQQAIETKTVERRYRNDKSKRPDASIGAGLFA